MAPIPGVLTPPARARCPARGSRNPRPAVRTCLALFDADQHRILPGAGQAERPVGVEHREGVFVGVVPHHVLSGSSIAMSMSRTVRSLAEKDAVAAPDLAVERVARDRIRCGLNPFKHRRDRLHRVGRPAQRRHLYEVVVRRFRSDETTGSRSRIRPPCTLSVTIIGIGQRGSWPFLELERDVRGRGRARGAWLGAFMRARDRCRDHPREPQSAERRKMLRMTKSMMRVRAGATQHCAVRLVSPPESHDVSGTSLRARRRARDTVFSMSPPNALTRTDGATRFSSSRDSLALEKKRLR